MPKGTAITYMYSIQFHKIMKLRSGKQIGYGITRHADYILLTVFDWRAFTKKNKVNLMTEIRDRFGCKFILTVSARDHEPDPRTCHINENMFLKLYKIITEIENSPFQTDLKFEKFT